MERWEMAEKNIERENLERDLWRFEVLGNLRIIWKKIKTNWRFGKTKNQKES